MSSSLARLPFATRAAARTGGVAIPFGLGLVVVSAVSGLVGRSRLPDPVGGVIGWMAVVGATILVAGILLQFFRPIPSVAARELAPPVRGRWVALNSPASRVPSHGTHAYGQTFAIDLVLDDPDGGRSRPQFGSGPGSRPNEEYPAFGQELYAPVAGRVVSATDRAKDHPARASWAALVLMLVQGVFRELGGPGRVLGNHLVIDAGDTTFVVMAHLKHQSLRVHTGDAVTAGQVVAECGDTGNASEPHLHIQVTDSPHVSIAVGLPMGFVGAEIDGAEGPALPANAGAMRVW
jgi:hypothetical protein